MQALNCETFNDFDVKSIMYMDEINLIINLTNAYSNSLSFTFNSLV